MNIAKIDLRLLVVFDAVMTERSVTRAADRLRLTQPAVSNAIGRLRLLLRDELFVRTSGGVRPTPMALELAAPLSQALRQIEIALFPSSFTPVDAELTLNLAVSDQVGTVLLPLMAGHLEKVAPGIKLQILPKVDEDLPRQMERHLVDFAIGVLHEKFSQFSALPLYEDNYVCLMRRQHPLARAQISIKEFITARHLLVRSAGGATGLIDEIFEKKGLHRRIAMTTSQVLAVPTVVENSDMIATLLGRTADQLREMNHRLHYVPLPFQLGPVTIGLMWHSSMTNHKVHAWMRSVLVDLCKNL